MYSQVLSLLPENHPWRDKILFYESVDSTNTLAKQLAFQGAAHGTVILADRQTGGRGRVGRSFHSPAGMGIYMSVILRPDSLGEDCMHLTCAAAVAACDAVESAIGIRPQIKWTNDLICDGRKIAGILTELAFSNSGKPEYAIVGIGINCCQQLRDFSLEIQEIAGSLAMVSNKQMDKSLVAACLIQALERMDSNLFSRKTDMMQSYRNSCITIGQEVSLVRDGQTLHGKALNVDDAGGLLVRYHDGSEETIRFGEVQVRGMYGYL